MGEDNPSPITDVRKVVISGDSTLDAYACRTETIASKLFTGNEISEGYLAVNIAVQGHTINQQLAVWNNLTNKTEFDCIIVQIGLNDMNGELSNILTNYQSYINQINSTKRSDAKVFISCMLPCRQRWVDLGLFPTAQNNWEALNSAIMTSINGVDKRNNYHVALMSDGNGNLATQYNCGDNIHENQAGANVIIQGFRKMIFND